MASTKIPWKISRKKTEESEKKVKRRRNQLVLKELEEKITETNERNQTIGRKYLM